jgi:hypothetical protein
MPIAQQEVVDCEFEMQVAYADCEFHVAKVVPAGAADCCCVTIDQCVREILPPECRYLLRDERR